MHRARLGTPSPLELHHESAGGSCQRRSEPFEERKHRLDVAFRDREIAIKEEELRLRRDDFSRSRWLNPLNVAIIATALAGLGNAYVAWSNSRAAVELEQLKEAETVRFEDRRSRMARIDEVADAFRNCSKEVVDASYTARRSADLETMTKACDRLQDTAARLDTSRWPEVAELKRRADEASFIYDGLWNAVALSTNLPARSFTLLAVRTNMYTFDWQAALPAARGEPKGVR